MDHNGKYAPVPGNIPGAELNLSGVVFVAAPFNLDGMQTALPRLDALQKEIAEAKPGPENLEALFRGAAEIIILSLHRNNPDLTLDELVPLIDMGNWERALLTVCGASGIKFAAGESRPASP